MQPLLVLCISENVSSAGQLQGPGGDTVRLGSGVFLFAKQSLLGISALLVLVQLGLKPDLEGRMFPAAQMLPGAGAVAGVVSRAALGTAVTAVPALRGPRTVPHPRAVLVPYTLPLSEQDGTGEPCGTSCSPYTQSWISSTFSGVLYFSQHCPGSISHSVYKYNVPS